MLLVRLKLLIMESRHFLELNAILRQLVFTHLMRLDLIHLKQPILLLLLQLRQLLLKLLILLLQLHLQSNQAVKHFST